MLHNHLWGQEFLECELSLLCSTKTLGCWQCTRDCFKSRAYCTRENRYKRMALWIFHFTKRAISLITWKFLLSDYTNMVSNILCFHTLSFVFSIHLQHCDSYSKKDLTDDVKAKSWSHRVLTSTASQWRKVSFWWGGSERLPLLSGTVGDSKEGSSSN